MDARVWHRHLQLVSESKEVETLRQRMLACAEEIAPMLLGAGAGVDQWRDFSVRVIKQEMMTARGSLHHTERGPIVAVAAREHPRVRRYTVAHELGHLLIGDLDRRQLGLSNHEEERLCEMFASNVLIPRADLDRRLDGFDGDPSALLELATHYGVSLSALLSAVGERLDDRELVVFAVSRRGHRKRPFEVALRAHRSLCGHYLVPEEIRLVSLGLDCLDRRLEALDVGIEIAGDDIGVELRLWSPGAKNRSGSAAGPASWRARYLPNGFALVCLDTVALTPRWSNARALA